MSKLHFKGGPWANAEDAVLKAALAQYGLRDWERVASMLTKKTATQCRERWENYLDPRLNIREAWSLEEEEKLVELQSLFPNKFRLISEQLTRRTPTHYIRPAWLCEQRYLELKDEQEHYLKQQQQQQQGEGAEAEKQSLEAFMAERRRRRNARKTHEERAARADTVSGELYEREMVSMATSRLANQDQKKGLRKERQRQLEEAAFLAKLESNREGIESGTLSLRQSKKMRKALEEDRKATGLVDMVSEDEEAEDEEARGRAASGSDGADDETDSSAFEAIDMYEDQQQAGLVKKQRILMKDLAGQQRAIQQRQIAGGEAEEGEGNSQSRVRAAVTGVNQDLLRQLTAGPSSKSVTAASPTPLLQNRVFSAEANATEAQAELKNTLADLFAALPQAASSPSTAADAILPSALSSPPVKRPREALAPPTAREAMDEASLSSSTTAAPSDGLHGDLFGGLNLPPPRKYTKAETAAQPAEDTETPPRSASPEEAPVGASEEAPTAEAEARADEAFAFASAEEKDDYLSAARKWVEVECEIAATTSQQLRGSSSSASPLSITAAEREAAEQLILRERRQRTSSGSEENDAVAAVSAYVQDLPHYTASVNVQNALHDLSVRVAAQVQAANAVLQPLRQEWERVVSAAMLNPREPHVLRGYVRDDGQLKQSPSFAEGGEDGASTPSSSSSVASYVHEHLAHRLTHARQATRFISALRDREQLKMRRDLDAAEFELQQLQAREKTLQDMYREKRLQQA